MKKFFCDILGRKKDSGRKVQVVQCSVVARRWTGNVHKYLDSWNRPTTLPLSLDLQGKFWEDLKAVMMAAAMIVSHCEAGEVGLWNFERQKDRVLQQFGGKKVELCIWPNATYHDPQSADFYDAVRFAAASGQPIEIWCRWAN